MKINTSRLAALVAALSVMVFAHDARGQSSITTTMTISSGIIDRFASPATVASVLNAIHTGNPQNGNWNYIANGSIGLEQIFNNGITGGMLRNGLSVTCLPTFTLAELQCTTENAIFGISTITFSSYSNFGVGYGLGPDGIADTADDTLYTSGNGNTPVFRIDILGAGLAINIGNTPTSEALNIYKDLSYNKVSYTLNNVTATRQINLGVPEPATGALLSLGFIALCFKKKV